MKLVLLGTNGWFDSGEGNTICLLLRAPDFNLILDAGNGIAKLPGYIEGEEKPAFLFLSHFHLDHIEGLHTLGLNGFPSGLRVLSGRGGEEKIRAILRQPYSCDIESLPFRTSFTDLFRTEASLPFEYDTLPLRHSSECFGLRVSARGKTFAYIPDTGDCPNARSLAQGADILVTECAYGPGETNEGWPHLNPEAGADMALKAGAKRHVLVHFDAKRYPDRQSRLDAEKAARKIFPNSVAGFDGAEFEF
jgi:ribonuclease BN (tRNA processing enzyme)